MTKTTAILYIILAAVTLASSSTIKPLSANPIPFPLPASMPLENMHIRITPSADGLDAVFTGEFTFTHIPEDVSSMLFPVPSDANKIRVTADNVELPWTWSSEEYPTILPETPTIPMIEWQGPFPTGGAVFGVDYEHSLIKRPNEFIFFYAVGTGKYFPTYEKTTTAYFDILLPPGFEAAGVWLDDTPHEYEVIGQHLMITVQSLFGPITNDLIVSLVPGYFDGCGTLVLGVECVLFEPDTGGLYALDNIGDFKVGDYVRVRGLMNPYCATICMQGNGCIQQNTISECLRGDLDADNDIDIDDFVILISHWRQTGCGEPDFCDGADLTRNGVVDINDLTLFIDNWLKSADDGKTEKPGLSEYYVPYDNPIEPNAPGYTLPLDLGTVGNYADVDSKLGLKNLAPLLEQNGFAITEYKFPDQNDIVSPYEDLLNRDVPLFVTADTLLHLYHIQFDETLKEIEENEFYADINNLTTALLNEALNLHEQYTGELKEAAKRNVAYLTVAKKLIDPNAEAPQLVAGLVAGELAAGKNRRPRRL
jgi:hypothetical protein